MMSMFGSGRTFYFPSERRYCPPSACDFLLINLQCSHNRDMVVKLFCEQLSGLRLVTHLSYSHHWISTFISLGKEENNKIPQSCYGKIKNAAMENLAFVREFCEHLILQCNQFCMKQHLFGERFFIRPTEADVKIETSFGEGKLVKSLFWTI